MAPIGWTGSRRYFIPQGITWFTSNAHIGTATVMPKSIISQNPWLVAPEGFTFKVTHSVKASKKIDFEF